QDASSPGVGAGSPPNTHQSLPALIVPRATYRPPTAVVVPYLGQSAGPVEVGIFSAGSGGTGDERLAAATRAAAATDYNPAHELATKRTGTSLADPSGGRCGGGRSGLPSGPRPAAQSRRRAGLSRHRPVRPTSLHRVGRGLSV